MGEIPQQFLNINKGLSEFDRPNDFTAALQYMTKGNKWVRGFLIAPIISAHTGIPIYIGQTNENQAQNASYQQQPDYISTGASLVIPETADGAPLVPTGPYASGSGASRALALPTSLGNLGRDVVRGPNQFDANLTVGRKFETSRHRPPSASWRLPQPPPARPTSIRRGLGLITSAGQSRFLQLAAPLENYQNAIQTTANSSLALQKKRQITRTSVCRTSG